jgi:hypothetical protein
MVRILVLIVAAALAAGFAGCARQCRFTATNISDQTVSIEVLAAPSARASVLAGLVTGKGGSINWSASASGEPTAQFRTCTGIVPTGTPTYLPLTPGHRTVVEVEVRDGQIVLRNVLLRPL